MFMILIHRIKSQFLSWALKISFNWPQFLQHLSHYIIMWSINSAQTVLSLAPKQSMPLFTWFPSKNSLLLSAYLNSIHTPSPSSILGSLYLLSFIIYSFHLVPNQIQPLVTALDLMFLVKCSWSYVWLWVRDGKDFTSHIHAEWLTWAAYRAQWEWQLGYKISYECLPWAENGKWKPVCWVLAISVLSTLLKASRFSYFKNEEFASDNL